MSSMQSLAYAGNPDEATAAAAMSAFYQLGGDALRIASDQGTSTPTANDIATYRTDLATYSQYLAGC